MKLNNKKSFIVLFLSVLLLTFGLLPVSFAKADTTPIRDASKVQLYYDDIAFVYHGGTSSNIYVKVNKCIKNRSVLIDYTAGSSNGEWNISSANFVKSLDDNYSIYKAEISGFGGVKYSIRVCNSTETYIDDNNGKYYTNATRLGDANVAAIRSHSGVGSSDYDISAIVKNIAYAKDVRVRYTLDSWKSYKEASLKYSGPFNDNSEIWTTKIDTTGADFDTFQYAISYTVNGVTYWDNNFGNNYSSNFYNEY